MSATATTQANAAARSAAQQTQKNQRAQMPMPTYGQIARQIAADPVRRGAAAVVAVIWLMVLPLATASLIAGGRVAAVHYDARPEGWAEMVLGALAVGAAGAVLVLLTGCALTWWATAHLRDRRAEL